MILLKVIAPSARRRLARKFDKGEREKKYLFPIFLRAYILCTPLLIFFKRERQASDRRQLDVYLFTFLSSGFAYIFRQIVIGLGTLSGTKLFALRHREKVRHLALLG